MLPISTSFASGPFACSASVAARPSQKYRGYTGQAAFTIGGDLRRPFLPWMPVETAVGSEKAFSGRWHVAQEMVPSALSRGS